jgi:hypothetical protein
MLDFIAEEAPGLGLGLVEVEGSPSAMIAMGLNQPLPRKVSASRPMAC